MYDVYDLALLLPLVMLGIYWWRTSEQKQVAVNGARAYCRDRELQLLDETLVFRRHRVERESRPAAVGAPGAGNQRKTRRRLCRVYEFDYSEAGQDRHSGEIVVSGYRVLRVILHSQVLEITNYQ